MTDIEHLVQDLRAHAHEAPAICAALMRRAASELARPRPSTIADLLVPRASRERHHRVKGAPCD